MVERSMENKNTSTKGWKAVQGKFLRSQYDEEKFNKLVAKRREQGMYYEDADFPDDVDDSQLLTKSVQWFTSSTATNR